MDMNMDMGNLSQKMLNRFFRKVDDVVWDLMTGKIGIKTKDGIVCLEGEGDDAQPVVNLIEQFGLPLPAFAQNTPVDQIKIGDLIYNDRRVMGWVIKTPGNLKGKTTKANPATETKGTKAFILLRPDGTRSTWSPPKVAAIGLDMNGAMVLRSLVNTLPEGGLTSMQGMLMPMLMLGGDMGDMESLLPMMLFSQMGGMGGTAGAGAGMGGMGNMMQMFMMTKLMGGMGGKGTPRTPGSGKRFFDRELADDRRDEA